MGTSSQNPAASFNNGAPSEHVNGNWGLHLGFVWNSNEVGLKNQNWTSPRTTLYCTMPYTIQ